MMEFIEKMNDVNNIMDPAFLEKALLEVDSDENNTEVTPVGDKTNNISNDIEVEDDEEELSDGEVEKIKQEIRELLGKEWSPEYRALKHFSGIIPISGTRLIDTNNFELLELKDQQDIDDDQQRKEFNKSSSNTECIDVSNINVGDHVHVLAQGNDAKLICSDKYWHLFDDVPGSIERKHSAMKKFLELSEAKKNSIIRQREGNHYPIVDTSAEDECFNGANEFRIKFDMLRSTFDHDQQIIIEKLLHECSESKIGKSAGKALEKLDAYLNISPVCQNRRINVSKDEIIAELDKSIYKLDQVKELISEILVSNKHTKKRGCRILLVGPPGTGKTCISKAIARVCGIPFHLIEMSAATSAIDTKGLDSSYDGSSVGFFVSAFRLCLTSEMVLVLNEMDKCGRHNDKDGDVYSSMLDMLDEEKCFDSFLEGPISCENTIFIATCNSTKNIPDYLLNRFEVIHIDSYTAEERVHICQNYILPDLLASYNIASEEVVFSDEVMNKIVMQYCPDLGMRDAGRALEKIIRRVICKWEESNTRSAVEVDSVLVEETLDQYIDEFSPYTVFLRNKDKYDPSVKKEIEDVMSQLADPLLESIMKQKLTMKLEYLTALVPRYNIDNQTFDKDSFMKAVNASHYGMDRVKDEIAKRFYVKSLQKKSFASERILLNGPQGVGKSSICESIAAALGIPYVRIQLNGITDEKILYGFPLTYASADAGKVIKGLYRVRTTTALVQLDEVDKMGEEAKNVLLSLLDDSNHYTDNFLGIPIDVSSSIFIGTCNDISCLSPWLRDRFTIINLDGYSTNERETILREYIIPKIENEIPESAISIDENAVKILLNDYCRSCGVRDLEKSARAIVNDFFYKTDRKAVVIGEKEVLETLGKKPIPRGNLLSKNLPGYTTGLAVSGGNEGLAFAIESICLPVENTDIITGLAGTSAKDSVSVAKTILKMNYAKDPCEPMAFHVHFGEGAVPVDGPSAGITILVSMLSSYFGIPVAKKVAMTGEINLHGGVYAIGGEIQKIEGAIRAGMELVIIPKQNYDQLSEEDLDRYKGIIDLVPVEHISEVVSIVLPEVAEKIRYR